MNQRFPPASTTHHNDFQLNIDYYMSYSMAFSLSLFYPTLVESTGLSGNFVTFAPHLWPFQLRRFVSTNPSCAFHYLKVGIGELEDIL